MNRQLVQMISIGMAAVLLMVGYLFFAYRPLAKRLHDRRIVLAAQQKHFVEAEELVSHYDEFIARSIKTRMELEGLQQRVPEAVGIPGLLKDVSRLATSCNINELQFTPLGLVQQSGYAVQPIQISAGCSYHALGIFLSQLSALPRLLTPKDLQMTGKDKTGKSDSITVKFTLVAYVRIKP